MTKAEIEAFNAMMMAIAKNKNRKFLETAPNEFTAMIPLGETLAELRKFTNFLKSKQRSQK